MKIDIKAMAGVIKEQAKKVDIEDIAGKIKKKIDWILIIFGAAMTAKGFFSFSLKGGETVRVLGAGTAVIHAYGAYYKTASVNMIVAGVIFFVLGLLLYLDKRRKSY